MLNLQNYPLLAVFLVGLGVVLIATECGRRLGIRAGHRGDNGITTLEAAIVGLLTLMIGFTFAMALARFDGRRDAVMNEANAIGTTALRARMLPEPYNKQVITLLREYVEVRLDLTLKAIGGTDLPKAISRSNVLQEELWRQAMMLAATNDNVVPTGLFVQALNDMIDNQGIRLAAVRNHVPGTVVLALFCVAAVAGGFSGYARGLDGRRNLIPTYVVSLLVCGVILLILDLDRPSVGFLEASQQPMIDVAESLAGYPE